jgi:hypothetical protein
MNRQAHTFHPKTPSFDDRVSELRSVIQQLFQARQSVSSEHERLGDEKEKREAVTILEGSLRQANKSFSKNELEQLKSDQLLSQIELTELVSAQRLSQMAAKRSQSSEDDHSLKR